MEVSFHRGTDIKSRDIKAYTVGLKIFDSSRILPVISHDNVSTIQGCVNKPNIKAKHRHI